MIAVSVVVYVAAMIAANLSAATFGPSITPVNAFFLVGLDLTLRNLLALKLNKYQMIFLISVSSLLSYLFNPASGMIAFASFVAFLSSALVDWFVFSTITGMWIKRCIGGVAAGAIIDSIVFPTIAFGSLMPVIVFFQFAAKVIGGTIWAGLINKFVVSRSQQ